MTGNLERLEQRGLVVTDGCGREAPRGEWVGSMSRVRLGAIGAGWWATSNHFPIFAARDDVELVGVCGIGPELEAVREHFGFGFATDRLEELLDQDLDAVVITTPHDLHHPHAAHGARPRPARARARSP